MCVLLLVIDSVVHLLQDAHICRRIESLLAVGCHLRPPLTHSAPTRPLLSIRFPFPSTALTQSIDHSWQRVVRASNHTTTAVKLQHDLTRSLEAAVWMRLFNSSKRYQQATLTALTLNPATSTWLTTPPLSSEPGYRMRDEDYRLAIRHRLGQLPFENFANSAVAYLRALATAASLDVGSNGVW